jgi:hypothetical protein
MACVISRKLPNAESRNSRFCAIIASALFTFSQLLQKWPCQKNAIRSCIGLGESTMRSSHHCTAKTHWL